MPLAYPVDVAVNPNNSAQRYVLWGNGRIDAYGGAVPITDGPRWFDRTDMPVAMALHISDWETGQGQVLDVQGGFQPLNGATDYMDTSGDYPVNTLGLPYVPQRRYVAWSWHPDGSGKGYAIDYWGALYEFGGELDAPRLGPRFNSQAVKAFVMQWTPTKKALTLDHYGAVHADFDAVAPTPAPPYYLGRDVARDLVVTDWANSGGSIKGYVLTGDGATHRFGGAEPPLYGGAYRAGADLARQLHVLEADDPTRFWQVHAGGQTFEYVASTAPTVTAGGADAISPADPTSDSTRPVLSWSYSDAQDDSQAAWELYVFTEAFAAGHNMSDPSVWESDAVFSFSGVNPTTRGVTPTVDLDNGDFRLYVRVKDTADQWSAWDSHSWTQDVPVPATPTGLTATVDDETLSVALSVTTSGDADYVKFERTVDGTTWALVVGAEQVALAATTEATDWSPPQGKQVTYRATAYSTDPRTASQPSATASATLTAQGYAITAVDDPTLGGVLRVQEPVEWTRSVVAGVHATLGDIHPTVIKDGNPAKSRRGDVHLLSLDEDTWQVIEGLAESGSVLVYRDPFGNIIYADVVGDWPTALVPGSGDRHRHETVLPLVEVAPPVLEV